VRTAKNCKENDRNC